MHCYNLSMATLYIVATPIGNLEDISLRALRVLKEVDYIACEDTRQTKKLLSRYEINTPTLSYHTHSGETKVEKILQFLEEGKNIALVTDAGTPTISDPGVYLVEQARKALGERVRVVPIPGASAALTALSASGLPSSDFLFLGFLPHKKGRETLFREIASSSRTVVFYESPHRLLKTLQSLVATCAPSDRVVVGRELTKLFESFVEGSPEEILRYFTDHEDEVRGEFVVMRAPGR